ncbi:hypothetical protein Tco_1564768, partial [Tanacetum coccineum]
MQVLKASKKFSRSQPHARGSIEGIGVSPGVLDVSTAILTTSSEETSTKPRVPDEVKGSSEAKGDSAIDWGSEEESEYFEEENVDEEIEWLTTNEEEEKKDDDEDDRSIDIEKTDDDDETDDDFVHGDEYVHDDVDEEIKDADGDLERARKLPLTSSSLSVSSGFGNQFLNLSSDTSLIGTTTKSANTKINSLLDIQIQQEIPHIQSASILIVPVSVIPEPTVLSPIPEFPSVTLVTTLPPPPSVTNLTPVLEQQTTPIPTPPITITSPAATTVPDPLPIIVQRVSELEKDVQELKQVDQSPAIIATIRSQ